MAGHKPIDIICGPTGSGKTDIALKLADSHPIEIISADSRQIYKHLDIGTAKPSKAEMQKCPFHLIDIIEPGERYSAFNFIDDAEKAIKAINKRGSIPILVGGTGLYLRALTDGVVEIEESDFSIRDRLEKEFDINPDKLFEKLQLIDPLEAAKIHPNNRHRIIRALEIFKLTGKSKSELMTTGKYKKSQFDFRYLCLAPPRDMLYERINNRVDKMLKEGLLEEIETLIKTGWKEKLAASKVIGYSEFLEYYEGNISLDETVLLIKQNSRRYAKRQMTWFRKQENLTFYDTADELTAEIQL